MKQELESKQLITFNSLHIEVLGPREIGNSQLAIRSVTEFLHAVELDVRNPGQEFKLKPRRLERKVRRTRAAFDFAVGRPPHKPENGCPS